MDRLELQNKIREIDDLLASLIGELEELGDDNSQLIPALSVVQHGMTAVFRAVYSDGRE